MTTPAFTPGPWKYGEAMKMYEGQPPRIYIAQADGATYTPDYSDVAELYVETISNERMAIQKANGALIAAAPELYEALSRMVGVMNGLGYEQDPNTEFARAALKKATGETK